MLRTGTHLFILLICVVPVYAQLTDEEIFDYKRGRVEDDTSYIYSLPYKDGKSFLLVQAANSKMSHRNELSLDFKMKEGSIICAARNGLVIQAKSDSRQGGLKDEYLSLGNHIVILHADSSIAKYWHLAYDGLLVKKGDRVQKGQAIAISGNTGFSAFPHLHFQVVNKDGKQILTRFKTRKGVIYLRPGKWYRALHEK